jgi:hypothetical protein
MDERHIILNYLKKDWGPQTDFIGARKIESLVDQILKDGDGTHVLNEAAHKTEKYDSQSIIRILTMVSLIMVAVIKMNRSGTNHPKSILEALPLFTGNKILDEISHAKPIPDIVLSMQTYLGQL